MDHIPSSPTTPGVAPLSDAEIGEMDDLLAQVPAPRESLDVVMLDGYLCGVLAQPEALPASRWMPPIFDWHWGDPDADAPREPLSADSEGWHAAKHERLVALLERHHAVLEQQLREDAWFDPLVMEPQDDDGQPITGAAAVQPALAPWVAGFEHAMTQFPALEGMPHDELPDLLACVRRHLPLEDEDERAYAKALDAEHPLKSLDAGIEDLVANVVALADIARESRFAVQTIKRETPKVGRNDPCPCGSGKKFKQCHGKT